MTEKKRYWLTPPELYAELDAEFEFDFDPCPYPRPEGFDGLEVEWGKSNYVNPPFTKVTRWVRKCIAEAEKGRQSLLMLPVRQAEYESFKYSTRTMFFDRIDWLAIEDRSKRKRASYPIIGFVFGGKQ